MKTVDVITYFGSAKELAAALDIKVPSIYGWGEDVPQRRQYELERITEGKLKATWPKVAA